MPGVSSCWPLGVRRLHSCLKSAARIETGPRTNHSQYLSYKQSSQAQNHAVPCPRSLWGMNSRDPPPSPVLSHQDPSPVDWEAELSAPRATTARPWQPVSTGQAHPVPKPFPQPDQSQPEPEPGPRAVNSDQLNSHVLAGVLFTHAGSPDHTCCLGSATPAAGATGACFLRGCEDHHTLPRGAAHAGARTALAPVTTHSLSPDTSEVTSGFTEMGGNQETAGSHQRRTPQ